MEIPQHSTNDSFSYSWLMNVVKSPLDSAQEDGSSFIEVDPKVFSRRWKTDSLDFDFHLPTPQSSALVHADQIISDGLLLPLHLVHPPTAAAISESPVDPVLLRSLSVDSSKTLLSRSNRFRSCYDCAAPRRPMSSTSSPLCGPLQSLPASSSSGSSKSEFSTSTKRNLPLFGASAGSSKRFLGKYLPFLLPFCRKVKGLVSIRKTRRSRLSSAASCMESIGSSSRHSDAFSCCESYRGKTTVDAGTETAIHDAVLHCKNSFNMSR
ncbi:unnamed protein product [Musa hybrid cultivar]